MTATQLPLSLAQRHNNQQLFSDHYLNVTLPGRPEWKLLAHDAAQALAQIAPIVRAYVPSDNEAQAERDLVRPVLEALGHTFEVQPALKTPGGTKKPDYVFYRDLAALNANKKRTLDEGLLQGKAFAVGDAKEWDRPLDRHGTYSEDSCRSSRRGTMPSCWSKPRSSNWLQSSITCPSR
jgi:hypothetical protein